MPITRPIPDEAWPVVLVLRRDVPRPEPERFERQVAGDGRPLRCAGHCPMGMHPAALSYTPCRPWQLPSLGLTEDAIHNYWFWFDAQLDPQAAVSATWDWPQGATGPA